MGPLLACTRITHTRDEQILSSYTHLSPNSPPLFVIFILLAFALHFAFLVAYINDYLLPKLKED
jgi:hypothetical protein